MDKRDHSSPTESRLRRDHSRQAIVIGGSLAGMLAARVLADHFHHVTILERDPFCAIPGPRQGVPQARHLHVLLARGRELLQQLFPGMIEQLLAVGVPVADMAADLAWLTPAGWAARFDSDLAILACSRDLLEYCIRCRLEERSQVRFYDGCDVKGLTADATNSRIDGVLVRRRKAFEDAEADSDSIQLRADLVVDATGRATRAPQWLEALGYEPPCETVVNASLGYASRVFRRHPKRLGDCKGIYIQPAPPDHTRGAALFPVEGNRWILTLQGYSRDYPPANEAGFMEFVRSLRMPQIYDAIKDAEPLSPIFVYRATENRLRHYERLSRMPERFVVIGDAACAFNPVFAQGMTMAALAAVTLEKALHDYHSGRKGLEGFSRVFQKQLAKVNAVPWMLATSEDFRARGCQGKRPNRLTLLMQRYVDHVVRLSTHSPKARQLLLEVFNLLKPPTALFHPSIMVQLAMRNFKPASHPQIITPQNEEPGRETFAAR
jgi:2-polyprenyl-6-methoxyphenol hydroxylase-like FAD-dependent oxidoreductase